MDVSRSHQNKDDKIPKRMYTVLSQKKKKTIILLNGCKPTSPNKDDEILKRMYIVLNKERKSPDNVP